MLSVRDDVSAAINTAVDQVENNMAAGQELQFVNQLTAPSWQYLYMLLQMAREDISRYNGYIESSLAVTASADSASGTTVVTVCVEPVYYRSVIFSIVGEDRVAFLDAQTAFDYMNTVFDDNIAEKEYVLPPAEGNLASGLTWPLQRYIRLRKSWYAARDDGARKHTGTDIWAREGTEIYSCTAGSVFFVGDWGGGGNTVVVLDDYGYMFYYHHMVSLSDFLQEGQRVEAGQLIGHVGNTGNSARDHLHLTIAHPDGILVNPYTYLKHARP
ncbi:MAG: M23 family metallopeptidase, partial [Bacillota bacterium]